MLGILKVIRGQIGKGPGDMVDVAVWKDEEARTVEAPAELEKRLKKEGLFADFEKLSYTHRKQYCRWIAEGQERGDAVEPGGKSDNHAEERREDSRMRQATVKVKMRSRGRAHAFDTGLRICETQSCCLLGGSRRA
jgi:hypothetical protein